MESKSTDSTDKLSFVEEGKIDSAAFLARDTHFTGTMWDLSLTLLLHAAPLVLDNLIVTSGGFGEALIMQHLDSNMITASAYISSIKNLSIAPLTVMFSALQPLISKEYSKNNYLIVGYIVQDSILLGVCISVPIMLFLYFIECSLKLFVQNTSLLILVGDYFHYFIFGVPPTVIIEIIIQFWISTKMQNLVIPSSVLRTTLQLSLNALFVFESSLGVKGLGLAMVIQSWIVLSIFLLYMGFNKNFTKYQLFSWPTYSQNRLDKIRENFKRVLTVGSPAAIQMFVVFAAKMLVVLLIGSISKDCLSAYYMSSQYAQWIIMITSPLATTGCVFLADAATARDLEKLKKICYVMLFLSAALSLSALPFFCFMQKTLALLFNPQSSAGTISCAEVIMPIIGISNVFFALKYIATGLYRGREETLFPMISSLIGTVLIGLSISIISCFVYEDPVGIVSGELSGLAFAALVLLIGLAYERRKINLNKPTYSPLGRTGFFNTNSNNVMESTIVENPLTSDSAFH